MKVSIIGGGGLVGSCTAFALQTGKVVREIALLDVNAELVAGQALDLLHGASLMADPTGVSPSAGSGMKPAMSCSAHTTSFLSDSTSGRARPATRSTSSPSLCRRPRQR